MTKKPSAVTDRLRRPLTRREALGWFAAILGPPALAGAYAFTIGPRRVVATDIEVRIPGLPGPLDAIQISDFHFWGVTGREEEVARIVNATNPTYLFITGDLVEDADLLDECLAWIATLRYRKQAYFCTGNWEHWNKTIDSDLRARLDRIGVTMMVNEGRAIEHAGGAFWLAAIDDAFYGVPRPDTALDTRPPELPAIVLSHAPCVVHRLGNRRADLVLSGHTHGGQVRVPFFGALKTPPGSAEFQQGMYEIGSTRLYVNRGIGTSILPVRINCPPEVTRLTLLPA
ncbi:metallophosphoesterase [bacterium]|nr:metallophosphoesterase [bacterium]